jgi:membrane-bound acyltransferase YfiQ involved in biofilm formation
MINTNVFFRLEYHMKKDIHYEAFTTDYQTIHQVIIIILSLLYIKLHRQLILFLTQINYIIYALLVRTDDMDEFHT